MHLSHVPSKWAILALQLIFRPLQGRPLPLSCPEELLALRSLMRVGVDFPVWGTVRIRNLSSYSQGWTPPKSEVNPVHLRFNLYIMERFLAILAGNPGIEGCRHGYLLPKFDKSCLIEICRNV